MPAFGQETTLSTEVFGYPGNKIYFDCVQTPLIRAEFYKNPGEVHSYTFETSTPVALTINGRNKVLLAPGDSLHVVLRYTEGQKRPHMQVSGSASAVLANKVLEQIGEVKRKLNYKDQLLSALVLDVSPQERLQQAKQLLEQTEQMIAQEGSTNPALLEYIQAEVEATAYLSMIEYPLMYEEARKKPIAEQGIGAYEGLLQGVELRESEGALASPEYLSFLIRYSLYDLEQKKKSAGEAFEPPITLEGLYSILSEYYGGVQRDGTIYQLLINFIRNGKEVERVLPLVEDYKQKYNINKAYIEVLDRLLQ